MSRGVYDVIKNAYDDQKSMESSDEPQAKLALRLELEESIACWYELLFNAAESKARLDTITHLRRLQAQAGAAPVSNGSQARYCIVNFLGYRTKTRFSMRKKPYFSMFGNDFVFYVELGKNRVCKKLSTTFIDSETGNAIRPHIELEENFITIGFSDKGEERVCIYDFLRKSGLEVHVDTTLYAIECDPHPVDGWLDGKHRLLMQMLYQISNEEHDFFFFCNLFKMTLLHLDEQIYIKDNAFALQGHMDRSSTLRYQYQAIEKAMNAYFQLPVPHLQDVQRVNNTSSDLGQYSVQVLMEQNIPHELYCFGSEMIQAKDKHMFLCEYQDDEVNILDL